MSKKQKHYEDDDGRVIADMNVDGMPWRRPKTPGEPESNGERVELTREEARAATWGALKAALLVALIFAGVFFLFILFADQIWLK